QQTDAIARAAEQIARHQQTAQTANDNQRQDLITLFERLGIAHQNSAEQADKTMTRLNDIISGMNRQLTQFADQTQGVLASIRQASGGLGEQSSSVIAAVHQAEAQVRAVMGSASTLSDQMRAVSEQAQSDARRTSEVLSTLLGQMDGGVSRFKEQTTQLET